MKVLLFFSSSLARRAALKTGPGPRQTLVLKVHGFGTEFNQYGTDRPVLFYDSFGKNFFNFTPFWAI